MHDGLVQLHQKRLRGKWTPSYEGPCAMTPTTMVGDELTRPTHVGAVKKYFVKIYKKSIKSKNQQKSSISCKPKKET